MSPADPSNYEDTGEIHTSAPTSQRHNDWISQHLIETKADLGFLKAELLGLKSALVEHMDDERNHIRRLEKVEEHINKFQGAFAVIYWVLGLVGTALVWALWHLLKLPL
jgi:hypothetical protein